LTPNYGQPKSEEATPAPTLQARYNALSDFYSAGVAFIEFYFNIDLTFAAMSDVWHNAIDIQNHASGITAIFQKKLSEIFVQHQHDPLLPLLKSMIDINPALRPVTYDEAIDAIQAVKIQWERTHEGKDSMRIPTHLLQHRLNGIIEAMGSPQRMRSPMISTPISRLTTPRSSSPYLRPSSAVPSATDLATKLLAEATLRDASPSRQGTPFSPIGLHALSAASSISLELSEATQGELKVLFAQVLRDINGIEMGESNSSAWNASPIGRQISQKRQEISDDLQKIHAKIISLLTKNAPDLSDILSLGIIIVDMRTKNYTRHLVHSEDLQISFQFGAVQQCDEILKRLQQSLEPHLTHNQKVKLAIPTGSNI
jgi:hypothetical protein